jgi:hypothetical protein
LNIRRGLFQPKVRSKRQPKLKRTREVYEFLVRYPWGTSSISGYRRAVRHFGFHTLEDPSSRGWDSCCLLIHRSVQALREAARASAAIEPEDWDNFEPEMARRGICVIDHDWKRWHPEDDKAALAGLRLQAEIQEFETGRFRVTLRKHRPDAAKEEWGVLPEGQSPMAVVEKARQLFQDAGLAFPAIPGELAVRLTELGPWLFSTRPLDASPYNLGHFLLEKPGQTGDYVVLSHSGHGANSYAIHYYLVHGCLCMFLQLGWGGVYMDAEAATAKIRNCFSMADRLAQEAEVVGKLKANQRLIVVASDFYGSFWTALGKKPLLSRGNLPVVLQQAIDWLAAYRAKAE